MDYELAKRLKDAGFLQGGGESVDGYPADIVYWPSLSEIIDSCGKHVILFNAHGKWYAAIWDGHYFGEYFIDGGWNYLQEGDSPEEAASLLWLALPRYDKRTTRAA